MERAKVMIKNEKGEYECYTGIFEAKEKGEAFVAARKHFVSNLLRISRPNKVYAVFIQDEDSREWYKKGHVIKT